MPQINCIGCCAPAEDVGILPHFINRFGTGNATDLRSTDGTRSPVLFVRHKSGPIFPLSVREEKAVTLGGAGEEEDPARPPRYLFRVKYSNVG